MFARVFFGFAVAFGMKVALSLIDEGTFAGRTEEARFVDIARVVERLWLVVV